MISRWDANNDVRNWGRWGEADELGTLNFITAEKVAGSGRPRQARQGLSAGCRFWFVGTPGASTSGRIRPT